MPAKKKTVAAKKTTAKKSTAARKKVPKKGAKKSAARPAKTTGTAATAKKKTAVKKKVAAKKVAAKKVAAKKAAKKKPAARKTPAKKAGSGASSKPPAKRSSPQTKAKKKTKAPAAGRSTQTSPKSPKKPNAEAIVSRRDAEVEKKNAPIVFSLDDIEALVAARKASEPKEAKPVPAKKAPKKAAKKTSEPARKVAVEDDKPAEKKKHAAASLADILGFNPSEKKKNTELDEADIPRKWKKYYRLLLELRAHVSDEISLHTSETLKHSNRDDSGDLSSYGSHQADAGTDTFDRDFALSLVSGEQEALNEIEEAILRIRDGSYGTCEVTGKPIPAARLTAVPFARYSVEGQIEHEKNRHRKNNRSNSVGIFGDAPDAPKIESGDDDE